MVAIEIEKGFGRTMSWIPYVTMSLLGMVGMLLIFIILLQRGRGGGLAGASAFGTKAGDVFTKITVVLALIWVVLAAVNVWALGASKPIFKPGDAAEDAAAVKSDGSEGGLGSLPEGALDLPPATGLEKPGMSDDAEKAEEAKPADVSPADKPTELKETAPAEAPAADSAKPEPAPETKPAPEEKPEEKPQE
ncbi:MAG: preprotein translocase subunit SecG [Planctomycetales bacterium 12-60-4]|nr:MAG: preprotein translocase subunit SecG [Planctomycetales bacterium 12-60-4]